MKSSSNHSLFNHSRFVKMLRLEWTKRSKVFWFSTLILVIILIFIYTSYALGIPSVADVDESPGMAMNFIAMRFRANMLPMIALVYIVGLAAIYWKEYDRSASAIPYLCLPASASERLLSGLFIGLILPIVSVLFCIISVDFVFVSIFRQLYPYLEDLSGGQQFTTFVEFIVEENLWALLLIGLFIGSCFLLGPVLFKGYTFIKTAIALLGAGFTIAYVSSAIISTVYPDMIDVRTENGPSEAFQVTAVFLIYLVIFVFFWAILYRVLKEREV